MAQDGELQKTLSGRDKVKGAEMPGSGRYMRRIGALWIPVSGVSNPLLACSHFPAVRRLGVEDAPRAGLQESPAS